MGILSSNVAVGVGAAVAATILAPVLLPVIGTVGRPLAKSFIRTGLMLYERSREAVALAGEVAEDMIAEIRAEDAAAAVAAAAAASAGAATQAQQAQQRPQQEEAPRPAPSGDGAAPAQTEGAVPMQAVPPAASASAGAH